MSPARKTARTRSAQAEADLASAEAANTPFSDLRFSSVRNALAWYFERSQTLTSPQGMHPRTYRAGDGSQVLVSVDGGKGGDFDDVLATMASIRTGLARLKTYFPRGHKILIRIYVHGESQRHIAERNDWSTGSVSNWRGRAEKFLVDQFGADVLR